MRGFAVLFTILASLVIWLFAAAPDAGVASHPASSEVSLRNE